MIEFAFSYFAIRRTVLGHDTPPAEFVRETILVLARNPGSATAGSIAPSLAPLIERMFRYTWILATEKRDATVREGREDELDSLLAEARPAGFAAPRPRRLSRIGASGQRPGPSNTRSFACECGGLRRIAAHGERNAVGWVAHCAGDRWGRAAPGR